MNKAEHKEYYFDSLLDDNEEYLYVFINRSHTYRYYGLFAYTNKLPTDINIVINNELDNSVGTVELELNASNVIVSVNIILVIENKYNNVSIKDITFMYYNETEI